MKCFPERVSLVLWEGELLQPTWWHHLLQDSWVTFSGQSLSITLSQQDDITFLFLFILCVCLFFFCMRELYLTDASLAWWSADWTHVTGISRSQEEETHSCVYTQYKYTNIKDTKTVLETLWCLDTLNACVFKHNCIYWWFLSIPNIKILISQIYWSPKNILHPTDWLYGKKIPLPCAAVPPLCLLHIEFYIKIWSQESLFCWDYDLKQ